MRRYVAFGSSAVHDMALLRRGFPRGTVLDRLRHLPVATIFLLLLAVHVALSGRLCAAQSSLCRTACGAIPIRYPFAVDDGCGSAYYRNMLVCSNASVLYLRTPSGTYPVTSVDYEDPHLVVTDPSMWSCRRFHNDADFFDGVSSRPATRATPFSLDTSTRFSLSAKNDYLFFNCSEDAVIVEPRPSLCERFPDRCDSACDSAGYLCRNLPECPEALAGRRTTCCSYYPKASESLRMMLRHCAAYASVYWRTVGANFPPYDQVPEYGIRVDFEIPVTTRCLQCRDATKGGDAGTCGFDTASRSFLCLCEGGNSTASCADIKLGRHHISSGVIAGTTIVSFVAVIGVGGLMWYIRKMRINKVVACGVQRNENRLF